MHDSQTIGPSEPMLAEEQPRRSRLTGGRRLAATVLLAAGLVAVGGVATVSAASPSPSNAATSSTAPTASQAPAHNCPNMGSGSSYGSTGSTAQ